MTARITDDTVAELRSVIAPLDTVERRAAYRSGDFPRADSVRELDRRYRWDLLWASGAARTLYELDGLTDAHIDTALRKIVGPL